MKTNLLLLCLMLGSCTGFAQRKELRKARKKARHERRYHFYREKLGKPECTDTIAPDTVLVPKEVHDTTFKITHDTTHYETERVLVKHFYNHTDSTVFIQAECKEAEIIHTVNTIKETKTEYKYPLWIESGSRYLKFTGWGLLVIIGVSLLIATVIVLLKLAKKIGL